GIRDDLVTGVQTCALPISSIGRFEQDGKTVYVNMTDAHVPSSLAGTVIAVLGLNNAGRMSTPIRKQMVSSVGTPAVHFYPPQGRSEEHTSELQSSDHLVFR